MLKQFLCVYHVIAYFLISAITNDASDTVNVPTNTASTLNTSLPVTPNKPTSQSTRTIESARLSIFIKNTDTTNTDFKSAVLSLGRQGEKFTIIFMDPPYYKNMFIDALSSVDENNLLEEDGIIVVEHDTKDSFPDNVGRLYKDREKKYGNTTLTFYKMEEA